MSDSFRGRPRVGAIRWDAWSGGNVSRLMEKTLEPEQYRFRLPWFATVDRNNQVHIDGGTPEIMEQEIRYAVDGGIDFWAFCEYDGESELSTPLHNYLACPSRSRVQFSMILHSCIATDDAAWPRDCQRLAKLLMEPTHLRLSDGRPVVFCFRPEAQDGRIAARIADYRAAARKLGAAQPYLTFMAWEPGRDWERCQRMGFDCVSAYAFGCVQPDGCSAPFSDLVNTTERQWAAIADANVPAIPFISTGWDKRPRMDYPVPWELNDDYHRDRRYIETARPEEIAVHAGRCLEWIRQHPQNTPANAAICYAWNENDEGGWLIPTRNLDGTPNNERLDALGNVLRT